MNNIAFVPIDTILDEWIEDMDLDRDRINYERLIRWASDCRKWIQVPEQLRQKIKLLQVSNGKVELPQEFRKLQQISCRVREHKKQCTTVQTVSSWLKHDYYNDVDVEITLKCGKCGKDECTCQHTSIDIDIDRIWERQNWHLQSYSKFAKPSKFGYNKSVYSDKFELMSHATKTLHAVNYHIPECYNLKALDCTYKYVFNSYNILSTDLPKNSEVLITYLADSLDEEGNFMVPDHSDAIDAIKFHLSSRHFLSKYHSSLDNKFLQSSEYFKASREESIRLARSSMEQMDYQEINSFFSELLDWNNPLAGRGKNPYIQHKAGY